VIWAVHPIDKKVNPLYNPDKRPRRANSPHSRFRLKYAKQEEIMPLYIMMSRLTDEGRKTVKTNPYRIKEVNKEVESYGVKVIAQYVLLGEYDFINVVEAPDAETIAKVATELGSRGTLQIHTFAALTLDDFISTLIK
jgi:uncharacterized protein with GYD domain